MYPNSGNSQYHLFSVNDVGKDNNNQVYHMPRSTGTESFGENSLATKLSLGEILNDTNYWISKFGYAVIVMHPPTFLTMQNGKYTKTIDEMEINLVKTLIDSLKSKNIHITSFSKVAAINS